MHKSYSIYRAPPLDGPKLLTIAQELVMILYSLLYAYPHIPTVLREPVTTTGETVVPGWFDVTAISGRESQMDRFRLGLQALLRTSEVLGVSLDRGVPLVAITLDGMCDAQQLSDLFGLQLYNKNVPVTCRQMFESICAMYRLLNNTVFTNRDQLRMLFTRYQFLFPSYPLPATTTGMQDRRALLRFCSDLTTDWIQPFFSHDHAFYLPRLVQNGVCQVNG